MGLKRQRPMGVGVRAYSHIFTDVRAASVSTVCRWQPGYGASGVNDKGGGICLSSR